MPTLNITQAREIFTQTLQAVYNERTVPTSFLRSFFVNNETESKYISIEVRRGFEKIAVDVERGTEGNRNNFGKSTQKIFLPPLFDEYLDATDLDFYDRLFTSEGTVDGNMFANWLRTIVEKLGLLQDKIERSYERQCAQVMQTGIVTLENGDNIDFKRKAGSLVVLAGGDLWSAGTSNPYKDLEDGAKFIRQQGKAQGDTYNVIMGEDALTEFLDNAKIQARADIRRIELDVIRMPQRNSVGGTLHGQVSAGAYKFNIWTYPEYFDTKTTTNNPYVDPKNIIIIPLMPNFMLSFAGVPQLLGDKANVGAGVAGKRGAFLTYEFLDPRTTSHVIGLKSAGVPIPVAIDQLYTAKVLA